MIFASTDPSTQEWDTNPEVYAKATGNTPAPVKRRAHRPNCFLLAYRQNAEHSGATPQGWLDYMDDYTLERGVEFEHATKVLRRWVAIFGA